AHVSLRYRCSLEALEESDGGVSAQIVDLETGRRANIEGDYLVGCDGASSLVRRSLGIAAEGQVLGHPVHFYFRAPNLLAICGRRPATFCVTVDRHGAWSNVRIIDPVNDMWRLMMLDAGPGLTPESVDREAVLRRALGLSLDVEWLGTSLWTRRSVVAERYS